MKIKKPLSLLNGFFILYERVFINTPKDLVQNQKLPF